MEISYNKLWKLLIDKGLKKSQLKETANISSNVLAKMGKNEAVSMATLQRICSSLCCDISDICEFKNSSEKVEDIDEK